MHFNDPTAGTIGVTLKWYPYYLNVVNVVLPSQFVRINPYRPLDRGVHMVKIGG